MRWKEASDAQSEVLQIAQSQVGVAEKPKGSNSGPEVDQYLAAVGLGPGYPWCAAFVAWCVRQAEENIGQTFDVIKSAWTPDFVNKMDSQVVKGKPNELCPGAIFLIWSQSMGRVAHVGFVEGPAGSDMVTTIEGNTNGDGSREGYIVCRRKRTISQLHAINTTY